jgi:hypothetical protein
VTFLSQLFKVLSLNLYELLTIDCDNTQTLQLITEKSVKLDMKLQLVDIYSHGFGKDMVRAGFDSGRKRLKK